MSAPRRRGWCPGALEPMASGDGLIVRVRLPAASLPPATARALAALARSHGNGLVDLTSRANLQIRGVTAATWPGLLDALRDLGLLDPTAAAERVRNVICGPLAGLDPRAPDVRPLALALERRLVGDERLHHLPAKFGFLIDGGGVLRLDGVDADIAFRADGALFHVEAGGRMLAPVPAGRVVDVAVELALDFLRLRREGERRMREVAARLDRGAASRERGGGAVPAPTRAGFVRFDGGRAGCLLVAAPFGRLAADQLEAVGEAAEGAELRLTPFRALLIAPLADRDGQAAARRLATLGLILDPDDPRLAAAACPGRPACASGEGETQDAAARFARILAPILASGASLHVSGCPKGCARRAASDVTLVAAEGGYRLARGTDAAGAAAAPLLTREEAERRLAGLARLESLDHA